MRKPPTLLVFPNPYRHLDADGEACCVVTRADFRAMLIGAVVDQERTTHVGEMKRTKFKYRFDVTDLSEIPAVPAHLNALLDGALIPADKATARAVGRPFLPLAEALEEARKAARAEWLTVTGDEIEPVLFTVAPPAPPAPVAVLPAPAVVPPEPATPPAPVVAPAPAPAATPVASTAAPAPKS